MSAFRLLNQNDQYTKADGSLCAGGSLTFYETGTTTAKSVYGEPELLTDNGNVLTLDSAARPTVDVWMSGEYTVLLKDSDGNTIWTKDHVRDVVTGGAAPPDPADGTDGQVWTTDGATGSWETPIYVPDMTGATGKYLTNNGSVPSWASLPTYSETNLPAGITQAGADLQVGKFKIQTGTGQAPTASAAYTTKAITFSEAYASGPLFIGISPKTDNITPAGALVSWSITTKSTTGFTVKFYAGQEHGSADWFITSAIDFDYFAMGIVS